MESCRPVGVVSALVPLQVGGFVLFRLVGLAVAVFGALSVLRPRETTSYAIRRQTGDAVDGRIEPTPLRLRMTQVVGALAAIFGLWFAFGLAGP